MNLIAGGIPSNKNFHAFHELLTQVTLAPPSQIRYHSQKDESRVACFLPMPTGIPIGFSVGCEVDGGGRIPGPVSTRSAQAVVVDASNLHESAGKGCKHRGNPSRKEEDDRYRNADPFTPQATKPTVCLPKALVLRGFEVAPS